MIYLFWFLIIAACGLSATIGWIGRGHHDRTDDVVWSAASEPARTTWFPEESIAWPVAQSPRVYELPEPFEYRPVYPHWLNPRYAELCEVAT